jgi:hypothetical protein
MRTKRSAVRTAEPTLFGPRESSAFTPQRNLPTSPSAAYPADPKSDAPSADILRAQWLLRDVLLREDVTEDVLLADEVRDGLDQVCRLLDHLAGQQHMFEFWVEMKR